MIIVLHNQLWGSVEYGVGEMMVKSKFRGFVSSELPGVPNTREIRYFAMHRTQTPAPYNLSQSSILNDAREL